MVNYGKKPLFDLSDLRQRFSLLMKSPPSIGRSKVRVPSVDAPLKHRFIADLPSELWLQIIRLATQIHPNPLDTTRCVSYLEPSPCSLPAYRTSMKSKRALALVSKRWNALVQEVLYEFVWISRASQAKALAHTVLSQELVQCQPHSGRHIRGLHIETPALERCDPADLRTIIDYAPRLLVYSDNRSVRRNRFDELRNPRSSPEQLFSALAHPNNILRRLSWTNYDDISFQLHVSPMLEMTAAHLEYLELSFLSPPRDLNVTANCETPFPIALPGLRSLKVALDNATFSILAAWEMPALRNLSVVSADFSYASFGFANFFRVHGPKITQLELGHSTSSIEEHYLTMPPHLTHPGGGGPTTIAKWLPNLREFVCSADAEWNWQMPDWIAPHILLPSHPTVELIGIRDIDKRLLSALSLPFTTSSTTMGDGGEEEEERESRRDATPLFPLLEQLSSLLRLEAFPSLRCVRDMSWASADMRVYPTRLSTVRFWTKVLHRCAERDVRLEAWNGCQVTAGDLVRAKSHLTSAARS